MAQMDDNIGALLKHLDDIGEADNTIVVFTTDNGAEVFTWPDGGMTPFKATKGTVYEGGFRVPCIVRWPGHIKPGTVENGIFSGLDWFPTFLRRRRQSEHHRPTSQGREAWRPDLQEPPRRLQPDGPCSTGKGPSKRHELFYFGGPHLGAVRVDDFKFQFFQQPQGWPGRRSSTDMPGMVNIRQDPVRADADDRWRNALNDACGYRNDFYRPRVLAVCPRAAGSWQTCQDGHRLPADAGPGLVQPRAQSRPRSRR